MLPASHSLMSFVCIFPYPFRSKYFLVSLYLLVLNKSVAWTRCVSCTTVGNIEKLTATVLMMLQSSLKIPVATKQSRKQGPLLSDSCHT